MLQDASMNGSAMDIAMSPATTRIAVMTSEIVSRPPRGHATLTTTLPVMAATVDAAS